MTFSPIRGAGTNNGYTNTAVAFPAQDGAQTMVVRELNARVRQEAAYLQDLLAEINKVMVGQEELVERVLIALLADGHVLLDISHRLGSRLDIQSILHDVTEMVAEVLEAVEGPIALTECLEDGPTCGMQARCPTQANCLADWKPIGNDRSSRSPSITGSRLIPSIGRSGSGTSKPTAAITVGK